MYTLYKTAAKTARQNNLIRSENYLFDFSIFDGCNMEPEEREYIINECIKDCKSYNDFAFVLYHFSDAETSRITIDFKPYRVDGEYKKLYAIYKAANVDYMHYIVDPWNGEQKIINQYKKMNENNTTREFLILNTEGSRCQKGIIS